MDFGPLTEWVRQVVAGSASSMGKFGPIVEIGQFIIGGILVLLGLLGLINIARGLPYLANPPSPNEKQKAGAARLRTGIMQLGGVVFFVAGLVFVMGWVELLGGRVLEQLP